MLIANALQNAWNFFAVGGFFTFILLIISVVSITVIILRASILRERRVIPQAIAEEIERLEPGHDLERLQELVWQYPSSLSRVLTSLFKHLTWPRAEAIEAVQTRARHEVSRLESGLIILEITTGIAPLLGLLGTLSGLVGIFTGLGNSGDPVAVARGISEALNTTIVGLAVSVPSLTAHNYFQRRIEVMSIEMESLVADLIAKCYAHGSAPTVEKLG